MADAEEVDQESAEYWEGAPEAPERPVDDSAVCVISLTPEQSRIVKEKTGREVQQFPKSDPRGSIAMTMKERDPDEILGWALIWAESENEWEALYQNYLIELAAWQDNRAEEMAEEESAVEEAEEEAEQLAAEMADFFGEEAKAIEAANEAALDAWDPKGKKREKGIEPG